MDLERLRRIADETAKRAEAAKAEEERQRTNKARRDASEALALQQQVARDAIARLHEILEEAARSGTRTAVVYEVAYPYLTRQQFKRGWWSVEVGYEYTVPSFAQEVFDYCKAKGLQVEWQFRERPRVPWEATADHKHRRADERSRDSDKPFWANLVVRF